MNEEKKKVLPCIALCEGDIHPRVLTCGDPARAKKIADKLDNAENITVILVPGKACRLLLLPTVWERAEL